MMDKYEANGAMWSAVARNDSELMKTALEHGCGFNIAIPNTPNNTPLTHAAELGHDDVLRLLLKAGAEVNVVDITGRTALHFAVMNGQGGSAFEGYGYGTQHIPCVNSLLSYRADVNARTNKGVAPIHLAAEVDSVEIVGILLAHGAHVDAQTESGYTALHIAAKRGFLDMVAALVNHGADVNLTEQKTGATPCGLAIRFEHRAVADFLQAHGGKE
jgi:ankyrin repeat protein